MATTVEEKKAALRERFPGAEFTLLQFREAFGCPEIKCTYLKNMKTGDQVGVPLEQREGIAVVASVPPVKVKRA